jgi:hypothetical protein
MPAHVDAVLDFSNPQWVTCASVAYAMEEDFFLNMEWFVDGKRHRDGNLPAVMAR